MPPSVHAPPRHCIHGEHEYVGAKVSEAKLNGFPSSKIADKIQEDPYRFLICADKFQTGYDEPLLHTMYVDPNVAKNPLVRRSHAAFRAAR